MDTDCDDAGALLLLINAHLKKEITLLGVVADSICAHAAPFCKSVLDYYSLDIPVGEIYGHALVDGRFDDYLSHRKICSTQAYNEIAKREGEIYSAKELYRTLLSQAEDGSVTVLCVGMLTAVSQL